MTAWLSPDLRPPEPIDAAIARLGRTASPRVLAALLAIASAGVATVLFVAWHLWPLASLLAALGSFGAWGLIEHRAPSRRGFLLRAAQATVAGVGALAAVTGVLGVLFWALGPAPIL